MTTTTTTRTTTYAIEHNPNAAPMTVPEVSFVEMAEAQCICRLSIA